MPNFRRYYIPDAIVFLTTVTRGRQPLFAPQDNVDLWWDNLRTTRTFCPFKLWAYAILPNHIHLLLQPTGGRDFSQIINSTKSNFTKDYKARQKIAHSVSLSLWQPRFWDHIIRDAEDLERHFEYIHYNPIKHSLVTRPEDYGHSSYRYWLEKGYYEVGWGWAEEPTSLQDVKEAGEPT